MHIALSLALPLLLAAQSSGPLTTTLPQKAPVAGLLELTARGEIMHLPAHDASPFNALMTTRSSRSCSSIERTLMDVDGYPKLWTGIKSVRIQKRLPKRVEYEFDVDVVLSPTMKGVVEHPSPGIVVFHDVETGGRFWYQLRDVQGGCQLLYHLHQPKGARSGFVELITTVEKGATDSGELIGALASLRGVVRPEEEIKQEPMTTAQSLRAWDELASRGTVLRTIYERGHHLQMASKRRVDRPVNEVLWSIRNRKAYKQRLDTVKKVNDHGRTVDYTFGYFGGRVSFQTTVTEEGDVNGESGLTITERITKGDVDTGYWRWNVRAVEGGTEVDLHLDMDLAQGSLLMRNFAKQDPAVAYALPTQMTLTMMGHLVGGRPLRLRHEAPVAVKE